MQNFSKDFIPCSLKVLKTMKSIKYLCLLSNILLQWVVTGADNPKPCAALVGCKCLVSEGGVSCNLGTTDVTLRTSFDLIEKRVVQSFQLSESTNITKITDYFSRNVSILAQIMTC